MTKRREERRKMTISREDEEKRKEKKETRKYACDEQKDGCLFDFEVYRDVDIETVL